MRSANGGGQIKSIPVPSIDKNDIALHLGYTIEPVISGLTFPIAVTFDDNNTLYVVEFGYSYGEVWQEPKHAQIVCT